MIQFLLSHWIPEKTDWRCAAAGGDGGPAPILSRASCWTWPSCSPSKQEVSQFKDVMIDLYHQLYCTYSHWGETLLGMSMTLWWYLQRLMRRHHPCWVWMESSHRLGSWTEHKAHFERHEQWFFFFLCFLPVVTVAWAASVSPSQACLPVPWVKPSILLSFAFSYILS